MENRFCNTFFKLYQWIKNIIPLFMIWLLPLFAYADGSIFNQPAVEAVKDSPMTTIWVVGDEQPIINALKASAMIFKSNSWSNALFFAVLMAFTAMVLAVIIKRNFEAYNYIVILVFMVALFAPKTTVWVASYYKVDTTTGVPTGGVGGAVATEPIDGIPIGIAWTLGATSSAAKTFTELFDTAYQTPPRLGEDGSTSASFLVQGAEGYFSPLKTVLKLRQSFNYPSNQHIINNLAAFRASCVYNPAQNAKNMDENGGIRGALDPQKNTFNACNVSGTSCRDDAFLQNPKYAANKGSSMEFIFPESTGEKVKMDCSLAGTLIYYQMLSQVVTNNQGYSKMAENLTKTRQLANVSSGVGNTKDNDMVTRAKRQQQELDNVAARIASALGGSGNPNSAASVMSKPEQLLAQVQQGFENKQYNEFTPRGQVLQSMQGLLVADEINKAEIQANIVFGNLVLDCLGSNDPVCVRHSQLMTNAIGKATVDSAGEASMFQHFLHHSMNILTYIYVVMSPIMVIVIMALGLKGWKLITSYFLLAVWISSWLPLSVTITSYMLNNYDDAVYNLVRAATNAGGKQAILSPIVLNNILNGAAEMIASASSMLSMVPMVMFALFSGSAYGMVHLSQRAGMTGKDYVDESKVVPDLATHEAVNAAQVLGMAARNSAGGTVPDMGAVYSMGTYGNTNAATLTAQHAFSEVSSRTMSATREQAEKVDTLESQALIDSEGKVLKSGSVMTIDENGQIQYSDVKSAQDLVDLTQQGKQVVALKGSVGLDGKVGLSTPFGGAQAFARVSRDDTTEGSVSLSGSHNLSVSDSQIKTTGSGLNFSDITSVEDTNGQTQQHNVTESREQYVAHKMAETQQEMQSFANSHSLSGKVEYSAKDFNTLTNHQVGSQELMSIAQSVKQFDHSTGAMLEQAAQQTTMYGGESEMFANKVQDILQSNNYTMHQKMGAALALNELTAHDATGRGEQLHSETSALLNSYNDMLNVANSAHHAVNEKISADGVQLGGGFARPMDIDSTTHAMRQDFAYKQTQQEDKMQSGRAELDAMQDRVQSQTVAGIDENEQKLHRNLETQNGLNNNAAAVSARNGLGAGNTLINHSFDSIQSHNTQGGLMHAVDSGSHNQADGLMSAVGHAEPQTQSAREIEVSGNLNNAEQSPSTHNHHQVDTAKAAEIPATTSTDNSPAFTAPEYLRQPESLSGSLNNATAQAREQSLSANASSVQQQSLDATQQNDMTINSITTPQTDAWQYRQQEQYQSNTPSENKAENSLSGNLNSERDSAQGEVSSSTPSSLDKTADSIDNALATGASVAGVETESWGDKAKDAVGNAAVKAGIAEPIYTATLDMPNQSSENAQDNQQDKNSSGNLKDTQAVQSQTESVGDKYPKFDKLLGLHEGGYDDFNTPKGSKYVAHRGEEIADGKKLSDFTVGEVMQMQKNGELFAAGHYQITPLAMKDAVRLAGVSPDEQFSPEIQDKLFEDGLLKKAGAGKLHNYITGKSDDIDKAMLATAQEWAAFPVPHNMHITDEKFGDRDLKAGDSYYEGVKGNHSNMSLEDAKAAIEEMRANYLAAHSVDNQAEQQKEQDEQLLKEQARAEEDERQKQADEEERRLDEQKAEKQRRAEEQHKVKGQPEHLSQENHLKNQGDNKKPQPTTQKSDTIDGVSGSLNKLPTDHLPKGVNRVSVKEIYSTKLCSDYDPIKEFNVAATPVPCGANNPYQYNTPEYWIWEWTGHASGWEKAFEIARQGKMCQWNDAKTAAEHYIVAQRLQNDPDKSELEKIAHRTFLPLLWTCV